MLCRGERKRVSRKKEKIKVALGECEYKKVVREVRRSSIQCMGKVTGGGGGYNKEAYKERKIKS